MSQFIQPALYRILTHELQQDLPSYLSLAHQFGAPVLDLGAGLGRIGHPLLKDGHPVVFLEKDPAYCHELQHLSEHLTAAELENCWIVNADFTADDWFSVENVQSSSQNSVPAKFGLIILGLRTIHLLSPKEQTAVLSKALEHLHPNGALVIHHSTIEKSTADGIWRLVAEHTTEDGILEVNECFKWNPSAGRFALRHRISQYTQMGQQVAQWRVAHDLLPLTILDLQQSLAEVGFESIQFEPLPDSDQLVIATLTQQS